MHLGLNSNDGSPGERDILSKKKMSRFSMQRLFDLVSKEKSSSMDGLGCCIALVICAAGLSGASAESRESASGISGSLEFDQEIRPILKENCFSCHGPEKQKGDLRLDQLDSDMVGGLDAVIWHDVLDAINSGEMPPEDEPALPEREGRRLVGWLTEEIGKAVEVLRSTGGHAVLRRLNRYEYQNTMRDILGLDLDFTSDLPSDGSSRDGFKNNGEVLGMSSLQLEYYHKTAREALRHAIVTVPAPKVYQAREETGSLKFITWPEYEKWKVLSVEYNRLHKKAKTGSHGVKFNAAASDAGEGIDVVESEQEEIEPIKTVARPEEPEGLKRNGMRTNVLSPGNWYDVPLPSYARAGLVRVRVNAHAVIPKGGEVPRLRVGLGYRSTRKVQPEGVLGALDLRSTSPQTYEFFARAEDLPKPAAQEGETRIKGKGVFLVRVRNVTGGKVDIKGLPNSYLAAELQMQGELGEDDPRPKLVINWVEYEGPIYEQWPPEHHTRWLPSEQSGQSELSRAKIAIGRFMAQAYRRPVEAGEVDAKLAYFQKVRGTSASFEEAMQEVLSSVLVSPHFLYIVETSAPDARKLPLTDFELASRLSYFLWSTMPDEELLTLAKANRLHEPAVLAAQFERMLADPRSEEFVTRFSDQWLGLEAVERVAINPEYYPDFDVTLKDLMRKESHHFFAEVLREDLNCLNFIHSDFAVLNHQLAEYYGIAGPKGTDFERVALKPEARRGGLLTQGAVLLGNSNGEESHPVKRGVWVLEKMLGEEIPPPPPNVPGLDSDGVDVSALSLRERLEKHSTDSGSCKECHRKIDPWGFPFDEYNAIGQWRTHYQQRVTKVPKGGKKGKGDKKAKDGGADSLGSSSLTQIDGSGVLPDGQRVDGLSELKAYLLENRRDDFARGLVEKLLTYSLGRSLELGDEHDIEVLTAAFEAGGFRMKPLIEEIIKCQAFQTK
jgi:hypothetical protein